MSGYLRIRPCAECRKPFTINVDNNQEYCPVCRRIVAPHRKNIVGYNHWAVDKGLTKRGFGRRA